MVGMNVIQLVTTLLLFLFWPSSSLGTSKNTFQFCQNPMAGILVEVPKVKQCEVFESEELTAHVVTIYTRSYARIPAIHCVNITRRVCTKAFLRFQLKVVSDDTTISAITPLECKELYEEKKLYDIEIFQDAPRRWKSKVPTEYTYGWWGTRCSSAVNLAVEQGIVCTYDGKNTLSDMSNMKGCEIRSGKCVSDDGITIWDPKQVQKSCPYEKKGTYIGIVTNRTITVEALQSTFVFAEDNDSIAITVRNHCGFKYPIPMNNDVIVEMEASLPSQTRVPPPSLSVAERTLLVERKPLTELPDSENVKFQYLYEKLRDESRQQAESVMLSICLLRNSQIRMIQEISRQNPEQAARLLLNRDDITARNMGDALLVSPCRQILADEVYWNHRVGDTCYEFLPVRVNGMVTFAQPRSKDLIESSKIVSCINRNIPVYEQNGTWKAAGEDTQVVSSEHWGEVYFGKLKSPVSFKSSILEQAADMHLRTALDLLAGRTHSTAIETVSRTSSRKEFFDDIRNLGEEVLIELENGASQIAIDVQDGIVKTVDRWRVKEASMALFIILILIGALVLACRCGTYNGLLRLICCCCCSCGDSGCCSTSGNMAPTAQSEAIRWRQPQITEKATGMTTFNINLPASSKIADVSVNREALAMETDKNIEKFQVFSHPPVTNKQKRRLQDRASVA